MTTYSLNDLNICAQQTTWELLTNTKSFVSPFTGAQQTSVRKGSRWLLKLRWENLCQDDRYDLQAFFTRLNGQEHRFTYRDDSYTTRRGAGTNGTVLGSNQTGTSIVVTSAVTGTDWLLPGDWIEFAGQLKMVLNTVPGSGGPETIDIAPGIHISPPSGTPVLAGNVGSRPVGTFIMTNTFGWNNRPGGFSDFQVEAVEDVLVT